MASSNTTTPDPASEQPDPFTITVCKCGECDSAFRTEDEVIDHCWTQHIDHDSIPVRAECGECGTTFDQIDDLDAHQDTDHLPDTFDHACPHCTQRFETAETAVDHFWAEHAHHTSVIDYAVACPACEWTGASERDLLMDHFKHQTHDAALLFETESVDADSVCPQCGDELANYKGCIQHIADKHAITVDRQYHCTVCSESFETREAAGNHAQTAHESEISGVTETHKGCPDCSATAPTKSDIQNHYSAHITRGRLICPDSECDETEHLAHPKTIRRHYWDTHTDVAEQWRADEQNRVDRHETLECLYNINKHAKKYGNLGTKNYRKNKKTTAKANSLKKEAMYALKERVLEQIYDDAEAIDLHLIDGKGFYLVDFDVFSFHSPVENLPIPDDLIEEVHTLDEFTSSAEKERSDKSLKECLLFFEREFGLNANEFLDRQYLSYGHQSHFIGWQYLGDEA